MPFYPYPHSPGPVGPVEGVIALILFGVLVALVGGAAGLAYWREHRHGDQHRHSHQH